MSESDIAISDTINNNHLAITIVFTLLNSNQNSKTQILTREFSVLSAPQKCGAHRFLSAIRIIFDIVIPRSKITNYESTKTI